MRNADGSSIAHAVVVGLQNLSAETQVQSQASAWYICGGQSGTETRFSPILLLFPVSIIPRILHAHSFIYHWHYTILAIDSIC